MSPQLEVGILLDMAFEWVVKSDAANPSKVVRHLVHQKTDQPMCARGKRSPTRPLQLEEITRHRPCQECVSWSLWAKLAPGSPDLSEFEPDYYDREPARNAWAEAARTLHELAAWTDPGWAADQLDSKANELTMAIRKADKARLENQWKLPTVEHPCEDAS